MMPTQCKHQFFQKQKTFFKTVPAFELLFCLAAVSQARLTVSLLLRVLHKVETGALSWPLAHPPEKLPSWKTTVYITRLKIEFYVLKKNQGI